MCAPPSPPRSANLIAIAQPSLLNVQTSAGRTPLHYVSAASAVRTYTAPSPHSLIDGQYFPAALECLEALAEYAELDYKVQDEQGKTALAWACEMGADLAVEVRAMAGLSNPFNCPQLLVNKAPDAVFLTDKRKRTPVHWAMLGEAPIMSLKVHIISPRSAGLFFYSRTIEHSPRHQGRHATRRCR